jgi:peptidoglycan/xylan/chitin deacetylase (PgdA/CDA1 family)
LGTFIISLDCEGKWGMADHLRPYHHQLLTDNALAGVYERLVSLFGRYDIPATFAFVMAFTLSEAERKEFEPLLGQQAGREDPWLSFYWRERAAGRTQGWFQPRALETVMEDGRHEIACHSFCHRPMGENSITPAQAQDELDAAARVAKTKGVHPETFIFPRNEIGYLRLLHNFGYSGYRERLARPEGVLGRAFRIAEEFNVRPKVQRANRSREKEPFPIPPGYFFNWRFGARKQVPLRVTVERWRSLLNRTAATGGVAHLWLHPHNLITGPDTATSLERVLAHAAQLRENGRISILTQIDYCRGLTAREGVTRSFDQMLGGEQVQDQITGHRGNARV